MHPSRFGLTSEFEDGGCERCLVRGKRDRPAVLLAGSADDERYVDDRPGQIGAAMLEDAALKTLPMVSRHDDGCIV